nr:MAG TPA: hypothetical protein [Caudoviricetes sp.]
MARSAGEVVGRRALTPPLRRGCHLKIFRAWGDIGGYIFYL